jgi:uncharacterized SAM-binding protein YcdF (DUF218 family)
MRRLSLWLLGIVVCAALLYFLVPVVSYETVSSRNTDATHFDTLIVLGHPAKDDGSPDPEMRERVEEAVREYRAGVAPNIIMSGGAAHNHFVEAKVMADLAEREGVPANAVVAEQQSKDTIQNIWYSHEIMQQKGWKSAEVISSAYHLPRTALILRRYNGPLAFSWRTHASLWPPEYAWSKRIQFRWHEALGSVKIRLHGFGHRKFLPEA